MIKEYTAQVLRTHQPVIEELAAAETRLREARARRDRQGQRSAQRDIDVQRRVLASTLPSVVLHYLDVTDLADADGLRFTWQEQTLEQPGAAWRRLHDEWRLTDFAGLFEAPEIILPQLPPLSFWLSFRFTLAKPYISRDDDAFYVIDNPVRKDKVLRLPFVAPTTYKGALRSAARYVIGNPPTPEAELDNGIIERLFGTDKRRQSKDLRTGRLQCFPTFFREVGLEVINPHLRDTGAGDQPILIETATGSGRFNLLYVPLDLNPSDHAEAAEDIEAVAKVVRAMFVIYGLAAKKTSGYGVAERLVRDCSWQVHYLVEKKAENLTVDEAAEAAIRDFLARFGQHLRKAGLPDSEFPHWTNADLDGMGWGWKQARTKNYKRVRSQHPDWDEAQQQWRADVVKPPERELLQIGEGSLDLDMLPDLACERLATVLREEATP